MIEAGLVVVMIKVAGIGLTWGKPPTEIQFTLVKLL